MASQIDIPTRLYLHFFFMDAWSEVTPKFAFNTKIKPKKA